MRWRRRSGSSEDSAGFRVGRPLRKTSKSACPPVGPTGLEVSQPPHHSTVIFSRKHGQSARSGMDMDGHGFGVKHALKVWPYCGGLGGVVESGSSETRERQLRNALSLMRNALQILDEAECPADVGAHLDLAICRLSDLLPRSSSDAALDPEPPARFAD